MTKSEIIARFDALHPNAVPQDQKASWLDQDNEKVRREIIAMHENPASEGTDANVLYVYEPYSNYYVYSLAAHLYESLGEIQRYSNAAAFAEAELTAFENDYLKTHRPINEIERFSVI